MTLRLIFTHGMFQATNTFRHPEQLLLLLGTPVALLLGFSDRPNIFIFTLAACTLSSTFTSVAINTAFARRYGTLKYLAATPLGINGLVYGQVFAGLISLGFQILISQLLASTLNLQTEYSILVIFSLIGLVALFTAWSYIFASLLSAEKVLALANVFFIALIASGLLLTGTHYEILNPISAIGDLAANPLRFPALLILLNLASYITLKKVFKWTD